MSAGRFLIDECLSPELARRLATERGLDGTSVRDRARLGRRDSKVIEVNGDSVVDYPLPGVGALPSH